MKIFIFLSMIFCHIIDDYKLQPPLLNTLKQRSWWQENAPDDIYKNDYLMALFMHATSWSFMTHLPIALYKRLDIGIPFLASFIANLLVHAFVDDLKANRHKINLVTDQLIHLLQITITAIFLLFIP